jgi:RNA-binding protein
MELTGKQKRALRALAHHLKPVVMVGTAGLSLSVVEKVNIELDNHELIKIKVSQDAPVTTKGAAEDLHEHTAACVVQTIGRIVVLYKGRKKEPTIILPKA